MEKHGYTNIFVNKMPTKPGVMTSTSYGWTASQRSVPYLWSKGLRHIQLGKVQINSPWLVEEMANCQYDPTKQRGAAVGNRHDDRVSALLMALWAAHDWTGQIEHIPTESVSTESHTPNWQASDVSYEDMLAQWEDTVEGLLST